MAKTISVGTKLDEKTHAHLSKMAAAQGKSVSEVLRQLIEESLQGSAQDVSGGSSDSVLERLASLEQQIAFHHNALGELLVKAVKISTGARYFARLSASYGQDITSYLTTQKPMDSQAKQNQMAQFEKKCREMAQEFLMKPMDELGL